MKVPKKVICTFRCSATDKFICNFGEDGLGRCGDAVISLDGGDFCLWIRRVLEWQDIEIGHLLRKV